VQLAPVHAVAEGMLRYDGVHQADADDRSDEGVRARGRNSEIPRGEVPDERGKSSAKTIANPAADPAWMTSSTGSNATMPKATAPLETTTPVKFQIPDQTTAYHGLSVLV
jgi:hypothetical protein